MKLITKKFIAREFLILLSSLIIWIASYLSISLYNLFHQHEIKNTDDMIYMKIQMADSLSKAYDQKKDKQLWFTNNYKERYSDLPKSYEQANQIIWRNFKSWRDENVIVDKWNKVWSKDFISFITQLEFENPTVFKNFIEQNLITSNDSLNKQKSDLYRNEINKLKVKKAALSGKLFSRDEQYQFSIQFFVCSLIVLFGVRFIYYGIKWSVKTLRENA